MHPVSAHYYDSLYNNTMSGLDGQRGYQSRYSMPISVSGKSSILNENDGISPSAYGTCPSPALPAVSSAISPNRIDSSAPVLDPSILGSSTPDSPLNSSIDYKSAYQEVPAIFHRGGGKRGGIRLGSGSLQDLSALLMCDSAVPKSPLAAHSSGRRSLRSSLHSASPAPLRVHHLSLTSGARKASPFAVTDSENDTASPLLAASAVAFTRSERSLLHSTRRDSESTESSRTPPEANSPFSSHGAAMPAMPAMPAMQAMQATHTPPQTAVQPARTAHAQPVNSALSHSEDVGNLLRVLLAVSSKYDFAHLQIQMTCHCVDLNPNAPPDARLCYDFLNSGVCRREQTAGICRFRHLPVDHVETVVDKIRNGKVVEMERNET